LRASSRRAAGGREEFRMDRTKNPLRMRWIAVAGASVATLIGLLLILRGERGPGGEEKDLRHRYTVRGRIDGEDARALAGARVEILKAVRGKIVVGSQITGSDGRFRFGIDEAGPHVVLAKASDHMGAGQNVAIDDRHPEVEVNLQLRRLDAGKAKGRTGSPGKRLTGTVEDPEGRPLRGASLSVFAVTGGAIDFAPVPVVEEGAGRPSPEARSDERGRFRMVVPRTHLVQALGLIVRCRADGHAIKTLNAASSEEPERLSFVLASGVLTFRGEVRDGETDAPVAGARVRLYAQRGEDELLAYEESATDARGAFRSESLPRADRVAFVAMARAYRMEFGSIEARGQRELLHRIALRKGREIRGMVVDGRTGGPIEGAKVRAEGGVVYASAESGEDGGFVLQGVPTDGPLRLSAEADGYVSRSMGREEGLDLVSERDLSGVEIPLDPAVSIRGAVTDAKGRALDGVSIDIRPIDEGDRAYRRAALSDAEGEFRFWDVPSDFMCRIVAEHGAFMPAEEEVLTPTKGEVEIAFVLSGGGGVKGEVLYHDRSPAAGVRVRCLEIEKKGEDGEMVFGRERRGDLGEAGDFEIWGLREGPHLVSVLTKDAISLIEEEVFVVEDIASHVSCRIAKPGTICGEAKDEAGRRFDLGCRILLHSRDTGAVESCELAPGESEYSFAGLLPGSYRIIAKANSVGDYGPIDLVLEDGAVRKHDIHFEDELIVEGIVLSARDGTPVGGADVEVFAIDPMERPENPGRPDRDISGGSSETTDDGIFRVGGLARKLYKICVTHEAFAPAATDVDLGGAGAGPLEIRLKEGARVLVRVFETSGAPCSGAQVVLGSRPSHEGYLEDRQSREGVAEFERVPGGTYELWVIFPIPENAPPDREIKRFDAEFELREEQAIEIDAREPSDDRTDR